MAGRIFGFRFFSGCRGALVLRSPYPVVGNRACIAVQTAKIQGGQFASIVAVANRLSENAASIYWGRANFIHTSPNLFKTKAKKGKKMEVIVDPKDAEEFIDLHQVLADMNNVIDKLKNDYVHSFRIGADIKLLDRIKVTLEGDAFYLREVATIKKKSSKALELDFVGFPEALPAAEIAIQSSALNLNPTIKGTKLEVPIPAVTAEHRKTLIKAAKQRMNDAKEQIRKVRNHHEKKLAKVENVPKDTDMAIRKQIGVYVDATCKDAEELFKTKEKDLLPSD